eukprot:3194303-Prymnesium_polylepis.1
MSNRPETARQNHTALDPPQPPDPVKTKLAPRALYLMKPLENTPKIRARFCLRQRRKHPPP